MKHLIYIALCLTSLISVGITDTLAQERSFDMKKIHHQINALKKNNPDSAQMLIEQYLRKARADQWVLAECKLRQLQAELIKRAGKATKSIQLHQELLVYIDAHQHEVATDDMNLLIEIKGVSLDQIGKGFMRIGNYDSAAHYVAKAIPIFESLELKKKIANAYSILIAVYSYSGQMNKALAEAKKAIKIYEKYGFTKELVGGHYNLAVILKGMGRPQEALKYLLSSLPFAHELKDPTFEITILAGIGQTYFTLEEPENALLYAKKSIAVARSYNQRVDLATSLVDAGDYYKKLSVYDSALLMYQEGYAIHETSESLDWQAYTLERIASLLIEDHQPKKALPYIQKGLAITQKVDLPQEKLLLLASQVNASLALKQYSFALGKAKELEGNGKRHRGFEFPKDGLWADPQSLYCQWQTQKG